MWVRYLHSRVRKNKNFVGVVQGPTGSGKSYSAISIAELVDPNFCADNIVFTGKELMRLIKSGKLKSGSAIVFEEVGIEMDSQKWQSLQNQMLKYLLETFRHRNFILIMTTPYLSYISKGSRLLIHGVFETISIDPKRQTCKVKPQILQFNTRYNKTYWKYLRVITKDGVKALQRWNIPKPSDELIKLYEQKKTHFTDKLFETISASLEQLEGGDDKANKRQASCEKCLYKWNTKRMEGPAPKCPRCQSGKTSLVINTADSLEKPGLQLKTGHTHTKTPV
jgi:ABC-type dipeptide/oligopeptide/nickel transport system ATPase component